MVSEQELPQYSKRPAKTPQKPPKTPQQRVAACLKPLRTPLSFGSDLCTGKHHSHFHQKFTTLVLCQKLQHPTHIVLEILLILQPWNEPPTTNWNGKVKSSNPRRVFPFNYMHAFNYCTVVAACHLTSRARGVASKISQSHGMKCCAKQEVTKLFC